MSHLTLDNTMGAAYISVVVAAVLYGVSCVQIWYYYKHYNRKDGWVTKAVVAGAWISDTIHQALISHTAYTYLVTNYANPSALMNTVWSLVVEVLFNGFTALLVQTFFTFRIWKLSNRSVPLTSLVSLLVIAEFASVLAYVTLALPMKTFAEIDTLKNLSMTVNALAVASDVLIAAVFCTMLHTSRTGFKRSDSMINKLIIFSVNTGLLTSLCAIGSLVSIVAAPKTFIYICFYFMLGRLYCNSLLATLNARKSIRGEGDTTGYSLSLQAVEESNRTTSNLSTNKYPKNDIAIKVDTAREYMSDGQSLKVAKSCEDDIRSDSKLTLDV